MIGILTNIEFAFLFLFGILPVGFFILLIVLGVIDAFINPARLDSYPPSRSMEEEFSARPARFGQVIDINEQVQEAYKNGKFKKEW